MSSPSREEEEEDEEEAIDSFNALGFKLRGSVCDVKRVGRENFICTYVDSFNLVLTQVDCHSNTKVENPCQSPSALKARSLARNCIPHLLAG